MATTSDQVSPARLTDIILSLYLNAINSFPLTLSIYERKLSIQIKLLCILAVLMNPEGLDTAEVHEFVCVFCTLLKNRIPPKSTTRRTLQRCAEEGHITKIMKSPRRALWKTNG